jgi:Flp pilus assembly protein CpaB
MKEKTITPTTPDWRAAVRRRTRFYILAAVLLAFLFGFLVFQFFTSQGSYPDSETTSALFARENIPGGTIITGEMLEVKQTHKLALPARYLSFKEQAIGQQSLYPLVKGEALLPEKLVGDQGSAIAQRCPGGKWCIRVPVAWFAAAPPDLAQGDRVEIASALPGKNIAEAGFIATQIQVVGLPEGGKNPAYVFAVDDQEALNILYARVNEFQLLVLLRPTGG